MQFERPPNVAPQRTAVGRCSCNRRALWRQRWAQVVARRRRLRLPCPSYISPGSVIARLVVPRRWRERPLSGNLRARVNDRLWPIPLKNSRFTKPIALMAAGAVLSWVLASPPPPFTGAVVIALYRCNLYVHPKTTSGTLGHRRLARRRKFCAIAASRNSSRAPVMPRKRNRSIFRIRLRCAKSISTFLRSRRDCR